VGEAAGGALPHGRPLAREISTGRLAKAGMAIHSSARHRKVVTAESEALPAGDRGWGAAEFGRPWSCSWDRTRLQKSTGGVRPLSPMREERVDNEQGSSLPA
jgi:hypothetical protein